ncbi:unnamed protein product [Spodoptera littoralis]|uniref:Zinc finger protein n=1 Tax=Spodoptera littoralis TaxID=7109 RepID=A0A9P0IDP7_SPOLI|nr:unnamed protein product [Spodoptera littoralis]CAH1645685.1 unnamed protein product [Spodoptera littoralis]
MDLCRVCLGPKPNRDIFSKSQKTRSDNKSFAEIFMFCFDIQVDEDSKISTKICIKCYSKVRTYYNFKCLAVKSDAYLKQLHEESIVKNEVFLRDDDDDIKNGHEQPSSPLSNDTQEPEVIVKDEPKDEILFKNGDDSHDYDDDNVLLSVIKNLKYEYVEDDSKEEQPLKKKKKKKDVVVKSSSDPVRQICEECGKAVKDLKAHSYLHMPVSCRKRFKCKSCDKVFSSHSARNKHNKIKHLGLKKQCEICNKTVTHLKQHIRLIHNRSSLPFYCVSCGRRFISKSTLDLHMTSHTRDRPFPCTECDKKFSCKQRMLIHKRQVHDKEKTHLCQLCSKSFFKKYHLQVHLRSHSKEKPYECPECGKFFSTTTILKSHREIHSEEKAFNCTLCSMSFKKRNYLNVHMVSHTKVKRYPCQYCGIKFGRSDHRKRHEYTAHEKNFISA